MLHRALSLFATFFFSLTISVFSTNLVYQSRIPISCAECGSFSNQPTSFAPAGVYYPHDVTEEFTGQIGVCEQHQQQQYGDEIDPNTAAYILPDHRVHDETRHAAPNLLNDMLHDGKLDSFLLQLQSLLEVTNRLVSEMTVRSRRDRFRMMNVENGRRCNQPSPSTSSSFSSSSTNSSPRSIFTKSYVYAVFSLVSNDERSVNPNLMQHPICGHLRSDSHQVAASWYYMRRLKANFVTSLRQKLRVNQTNFRFVGCCESPNKNIALLSALAKILKRDFPAYCFNIQGHVITMSRVKNSQLMLTNNTDTHEQVYPTDTYIFNQVMQIVRRNCDTSGTPNVYIPTDALAEHRVTNYSDFC